METKTPLTLRHCENSLFSWTNSRTITHGQFIAHVLEVTEQLPDNKFVINLIENRYLFIVSFAAALVRKQVNLLPQTRAPENILDIKSNYPDCYCLSESKLQLDKLDQSILKNLVSGTTSNRVPLIDNEQIASITFTSGSTGKPNAHTKYWGDLVHATSLAAERFKLYEKAHQIVATVPPQHMYGLETSVLYPMLAGCAIYGDRPFYPADINQVLNPIRKSTILVTTPVHLRACILANLEWKHIDLVISATAHLNKALALQVQEIMHANVQEIFGCTETGSMASRITLNSNIWDVFKGFRLSQQNNRVKVYAPHIREKVILNDELKLLNDHQFIHHGRSSDMINIAGKRGSLADLNLKLQELENVEAGIFFVPETQPGKKQYETKRLMAFVVAPNTDEKDIINALANKIDPVFLPRPLYKVDQLPYNETGKLTLQALKKLHKQVRQRNLCQN